MKKKKVLILFLRNGDLKKEIEKEMVYKKVVSELSGEGRDIQSTTVALKDSRTVFQDGSMVMTAGVGAHIRGGRYTHIYVENGLDADGLIESGLFSLVSGNFENWETTGDRMFKYSISGDKVNIEKY